MKKELEVNDASLSDKQSGNSNLNSEAQDFSLYKLFTTWVKIGSTSFGGGPVTQYLIQDNFIYKYKWITAEEYANIIAISQIVPGINIFAYNILIGKKLAGIRGVILSLLGLILPSAAVTIFLSAVYLKFSKYERVHSALNTGFAAIFGISIATNLRNVKPIILKNNRQGKLALAIALGLIIVSALIYIFINISVPILYLLGGVCGSMTYWYLAKKRGE